MEVIIIPMRECFKWLVFWLWINLEENLITAEDAALLHVVALDNCADFDASDFSGHILKWFSFHKLTSIYGWQIFVLCLLIWLELIYKLKTCQCLCGCSLLLRARELFICGVIIKLHWFRQVSALSWLNQRCLSLFGWRIIFGIEFLYEIDQVRIRQISQLKRFTYTELDQMQLWVPFCATKNILNSSWSMFGSASVSYRRAII